MKEEDTRTEEEKRSYTMSRVRSTGTVIEVSLQKALWRKGIRYRKNYKKLPGSPDIVVVKYKLAIFCDGEFWHGKDWERRKPRIKNNREYWIKKIEGNVERDKRVTREIIELGWRVIRFWETEIKSDIDSCVDTVINAIEEIKNPKPYHSIPQLKQPLKVAEEPNDEYSSKQQKD